MDHILQIADIWRIIAGFCEVIPAVRLSSTCRWLRERLIDRGSEYRELTANVGVTRAAGAGDMSLVAMYERKATDLSWALYTAARRGHNNIITYLGPLTANKLNTKRFVNPTLIHSTLIRLGIHVRAWYERGVLIVKNDESNTYDENTFCWIATRSGVYGDMDFVFAMHANMRGIFYPTVLEAALHGHLEIIQLYASAYPNIEFSIFGCMPVAARGGHLNILKWIAEWTAESLETSLSIPSEVCYWASWNGRVDILEFAISLGAKPNFEVCINAVVRGHLDILIIALAHGAPPRFGRLRRIARRRVQSEILWYLQGK